MARGFAGGSTMPRPVRLSAGGYTHHVIQRGNNRQAVFFGDADRRLFLEWLGEVADREGCELHAYVLMTNHVHMLITAGAEGSISRLMQSLGRRYVGHVNRAHGRSGTLWEGRYKTTILDSDAYLLACYRYIEENPVRAGLVRRPAEYEWSSYRHNAEGRPDPLVREHDVYRALGMTDNERQAAYSRLFADRLDDAVLHTLRDATQRGWVPGSEHFRREVEAALGRPAGPPRRGRPPKAR